MDYNNKLVLITGGSSGIGKATAIELGKRGALIILQARDTKKLKSVADEINNSGGNASYYSTDLTDVDDVEKTANIIIDKNGVPDVVINSAGSGEWLSLNEASAQHYSSTMDSPYLATAYTCKVFHEKMKNRGNGHFIIINSVASYFSFPGATGYTAARWALLGLAKSLQTDLHNTDFTVSLIALGKVDSPYFSNNPISEDRIPKISNWLVSSMTMEESGILIANTVSSKKKVQIRPITMSIIVTLNRFFPRLFNWLMRITSYNSG